jgi:hypothetical protein
MEDRMVRACGMMGERRDKYRVLVGKRGKERQRETTEHLGIDSRRILKWILKKSNRRAWTV